MPDFKLQMLRRLIVDHPDRASGLLRHVEALELSIESEPAICLQRVRSLFEAAHMTIAPGLGVDLTGVAEFHTRNSRIIKAMDFSIVDHPEAPKISATIQKLLGSINGTAVALAELSNIPNMRHGGSLDMATLERQHARMLGGLCDSLVSFMFDIAWSRGTTTVESDEIDNYEAHAEFNDYLDEEYEQIEIAGAVFQPSYVLFRLDETNYDAARIDWETEGGIDTDEGKEAAA